MPRGCSSPLHKSDALASLPKLLRLQTARRSSTEYPAPRSRQGRRAGCPPFAPPPGGSPFADSSRRPFPRCYLCPAPPGHAGRGPHCLAGSTPGLPLPEVPLVLGAHSRTADLEDVSGICSRADGATAERRSPSQVSAKCHLTGHVAQRGVTPRTAHRTWARQCPAVTPRPTDGLDFSEVRTCKGPPTHRCAACHGSATRLRSCSLPSDPYSPSGEPLSPFEVELFAARFRGTPGACTPARSYLSPGQELPSAAGLYEHCSPYPLDGICRERFGSRRTCFTWSRPL